MGGRTADAVLGGAEGELDEGRAYDGARQGLAGPEALQGVGAHDLGVGGARVEGVALHDVDEWQHLHQRPHLYPSPAHSISTRIALKR